MERYYTIPMEVGLASTPGVDIIRSTSFYGLSSVRVTFNYGDRLLLRASPKAAISLQQNVNLPGNASRRRSKVRAWSAKSTATR